MNTAITPFQPLGIIDTITVTAVGPTYGQMFTCSACRTVRRVDGADVSVEYVEHGILFAAGQTFERDYTMFGAVDSHGIAHQLTVECCGNRILGRRIVGKNTKNTPCNGTCMGAKGPNCDCHCEGANHGKNFGHGVNI